MDVLRMKLNHVKLKDNQLILNLPHSTYVDFFDFDIYSKYKI